MKELNELQVTESQIEEIQCDALVDIPFPMPNLGASGLYTSLFPDPNVPFRRTRELRLDVDGRYHLMVASGTFYLFLKEEVHWIANLKAHASEFTGDIWYKDITGRASFPYTNVSIRVVRKGRFPFFEQRAIVTFTGGGGPDIVHEYKKKSIYFHQAEFEFDSAQGTAAVTTMETCAHPNHPASLACETLSIEKVYQRAGFAITKSGGDSIVPLAGAGANAKWSDQEMHDAMQTFWSRFADKAQWSMWVFFASLHEDGTSLGGIMFDDIGPNHRQGTSIFEDSFIKDPPAGDSNPAEWAQRMRFWTACHEMGHAFNLAHSWQKALGTPWIALANEPEARSFMNYPFRVSGGQSAFFADFEYRFSDGELLFLRHAPARFVQQGNADWFDHHGFQQANISPEPAFKLELRFHREQPLFEFLEPIVIELKLTNISSQPQVVSEKIISNLDNLSVIIKKNGKPARQFAPFAHYCFKADRVVLTPGQSLYESLFPSAGQNGWDLAEPGYYSIQAALHLADEDVVSNSLILRVAPPRGYDEEFWAQDFFSEDVGRILTFDGSQALIKGNDTLREITERFPERKVALHAKVALGIPLTKKYKLLNLGDGKGPLMPAWMAKGKFKVASPQIDEARQILDGALAEDKNLAAQTLGNIDYKYYVDLFSDCLEDQGMEEAAKNMQDGLYQTMADRKVLKGVLADIKTRIQKYKK